MNRRHFLYLGATATPALCFGAGELLAQSWEAPAWRTYEVTTSIKVIKPVGTTRIWVPLPLDERTSFQRLTSSSVQCDSGKTSFHHDRRQGLKMLIAEFPANKPAALKTTQRVRTRNWSIPLANADPSSKGSFPQSATEFLAPTRYVPTDGIVKRKSDEITIGVTTDVAKTKAIYEWIVLNTTRDAKVRGCGVGDIRPMLERGDLSGKCADLNALFVGLVKAAAIPARDVYGLRVGPSQMQWRSLGTSSEHVQKAQHCRAEVFLTGHGWVPMDPADVRKVMLEETPGNLALTDEKVQRVKQQLFGSWEMNWMAYNYAQDVVLPGSSGPPLHFFMYPQAETAEGRLDSLDPDSFHYEITSHEVTA